MSQFLSQTLSQQMRLEQRLTPQLIQSMSILQKPVAELERYIADALERNAALELDEPQPAKDKEEGAGTDEPRHDDEEFARLYRWSRQFDLDGNDRPPLRSRRVDADERDPKMGAMANTAGREANLHEYLLEQWALLDVEGELRRAGEAIIDHLDPDGYLRVRLEEIARNVKPPLSVDVLKQALPLIHKLDPPGVGARDVVECLLLQLDALPGDNSLERKLIRDHLDDIVRNRLPAVAKATGASIGEIQEAIKAMRSTLCLHPGYRVGDRSVPMVRPDVIVDYADAGGGLTVRLVRGNAPPLKIREDVAQLARSNKNGKETREFARKHVEEAANLIDAVRFRRQRLLEVARAIVEKQRDFFDIGPEGLKVLRMSDLAAELGCDPSTISRTVADKYMQTPRGIYPLRYFFTGGTETPDGESMGWDRVKNRVRELVEAEDKKNPLNDEQIAALLKKEGIEISRRTVAKYRQQLNIPAARQRKQY
ncbi:MAG: RNA polymerase sigma-54 factor [Planctomycetota bacterium]|nr:MAG: RNA polymerase sigma-54 factor [Planctomycetota bacterium]